MILRTLHLDWDHMTGIKALCVIVGASTFSLSAQAINEDTAISFAIASGGVFGSILLTWKIATVFLSLKYRVEHNAEQVELLKEMMKHRLPRDCPMAPPDQEQQKS